MNNKASQAKNIFAKILVSITMLVMVFQVMFGAPKVAEAREYIFGGIAEPIASLGGGLDEDDIENGRVRGSDGAQLWEQSREYSGVRPQDDGTVQYNKQNRLGSETYYGALLRLGGKSENEARSMSNNWYYQYGEAAEKYAIASKYGSNSFTYRGDGIFADSYTNYDIKDVAAFRNEVVAGKQLLELYMQKCAAQPYINCKVEKAQLEKANALLGFIDSGQIKNGTTIGIHQEGNLGDEGIAGEAVKVYGENGGRVATAAMTPTTGGPIVCLSFSGGSLTFSMSGCVAMVLYYGLLVPSSWVLWAAGVAFNYSLDFTLNFGKFLADNGLSTANGAIYLGWAAIRNLINVMFIFILLYAAIGTILGLSDYSVKQTVPKVVLAAILLNFSLFFTKAAIDFSNIIALQFYTRVLDAAAKAGGPLPQGSDTAWDAGISVAFLNTLGLKSIWAGKSSMNDAGVNSVGITNAGQLIIVCLGGSAFILITAFTLFMATVRFIFRSGVLIFLMILSPIGFVGNAIPAMKAVAGDWRKRLTSNLIFAPAYMAVFYVVCLIAFGRSQAANANANLSGFAALFQGNVSETGILFWFILIIILMMGTQMVADKFADDFGSGFSKGAGAWAKRNFAGKPARAVLGGTSDYLIKNKYFSKAMSVLPGGGAAIRGLDKVRNAKYFGADKYSDIAKNKAKKELETAKLVAERRDAVQQSGESKESFETRKRLQKEDSQRDAARYLSSYAGKLMGVRGLGKDELNAEGVAAAGQSTGTSRLFGSIPLVGGLLERNRAAIMDARKKMFATKERGTDDLEARLKEIDEQVKGTIQVKDASGADVYNTDGTKKLISALEDKAQKYEAAAERFRERMATLHHGLLENMDKSDAEQLSLLEELANKSKTQFNGLKNESAKIKGQIAQIETNKAKASSGGGDKGGGGGGGGKGKK